MTKDIAVVNYIIPGYENSCINFKSKQSLMDFDIILINPELPYYSQDDNYLGKRCYGETGSFELKSDIAHWKKEINNALEAGKTIFFTLSSKEIFYADTGTRSYSGNGKNRATTIKVEPFDNYKILPVNIGTICSAKGKQIYQTGNSLFNNFFKNLNKYFEYQVYLENIVGMPVFTGKDKSKILGSIHQIGKGYLVTLPYLQFDEEKFTKNKKNKKGEIDSYWTSEAIQFGENIYNSLIEIDNGLTMSGGKTPAPGWSNQEIFSLKKEKQNLEVIKKNLEKIDLLKEENDFLNEELLQEQALKDLLFEQGKPLEGAVIKALKILGYRAENYDDGVLELDQIITSPEGHRYIGECEGKENKDVDITKYRQLLESINADFAREEVNEKAYGILFGNAQRLIEPKDRTLDFTQKCKIGASRDKIALIKTVDLFHIARYLQENPDEEFKKLCRDTIHAGLGNIVSFPEIPING